MINTWNNIFLSSEHAVFYYVCVVISSNESSVYAQKILEMFNIERYFKDWDKHLNAYFI